ncbi:MAG: type II toxin-antitoxin system VapC family toxin [Candidatus Bathyarchaeia archaeon]
MSKFTVHASETTLNESMSILTFLRNVQNLLGLDVHETRVEEEAAASVLMNKVKLDFDDALHYFTAKKLGVEAIVSYDRHFDTVDKA